MWQQFSFENQWNEQGKLNLKQARGNHSLFLKSEKARLIPAPESKDASGTP